MPSPRLTTVLVVDDEPRLRQVLRTGLIASGFAVVEAASGSEAVTLLQSASPELVLLDINMPGESGLTICARLRSLAPHVGIVMVTVRDAEDDKVQALESGADDFVTKPVRLRELVARLHAVLRRLQAPAPTAVWHIGELDIDLEQRSVRKAGQEIHLSPTEFDLLACLVKQRGRPVPHRVILREVWGPEYGGELEYLRSYVKMLRRKLEDDPAHPRYLVTEPWLGYRFRLDPRE